MSRVVTAIDTNILLYAFNEAAPENARARSFVNERQHDADTVISELGLLELYVLLRNPAVLSQPLPAGEAVAVIGRLRSHPRWRVVDHVPAVMDDVWALAARGDFPRRRVFDIPLALGLRRHGVTRFATRNTRDFEGLGFEAVFDPLL